MFVVLRIAEKREEVGSEENLPMKGSGYVDPIALPFSLVCVRSSCED